LPREDVPGLRRPPRRPPRRSALLLGRQPVSAAGNLGQCLRRSPRVRKPLNGEEHLQVMLHSLPQVHYRVAPWAAALTALFVLAVGSTDAVAQEE
jgi:hypothetical protein